MAQSHFADDLAPFFAIPDVRATRIPSILVPRSIDDNKGFRTKAAIEGTPWRSRRQESHFAHRVEKQRNSPYISEKKKVFRVIALFSRLDTLAEDDQHSWNVLSESLGLLDVAHAPWSTILIFISYALYMRLYVSEYVCMCAYAYVCPMHPPVIYYQF